MARTVSPGPGPCPSEEQLFAYAAGSGRMRDPETLLIHLDGCGTCRHLLAEASRSLESSPPAPSVKSVVPVRSAPLPVVPLPSPGPAQIRTLEDGELVVDRYRIERFLAQGGMGEVYLAQDLLLEETVALKTLACTALDDQRAAFRFKAEARLARRVTHPNVCRILEFGLQARKRGKQSESVPFLTMEFLNGETLNRRITKRGAMPEAEAIALLQQVLTGLQAIHACGIVHRDLKSENVFLVPDPRGERAVVMDFGLARALDGSVVSTWPLARMLAGTIDTMAPEQIEGRTPEPSMDIFAFGVLLFEVLTGRRPFIDTPPMKRLREKAPLPSSVNANLHPRWDRIIGKCMELAPAARYPDFGEVAAALAKAARPVAGASF
jgi:serine/threonine protein kinase